jgi:hypothetical protein
MTWAEAKSKSTGVNHDGSKQKKKPVIQVSHADALTAKIVRKNSAPPDFTKAELRRARKQEEKAVALAAKMAEEREAQRREREGRTVCPTDLAQERMAAETTKRRKRAMPMPMPTTAATMSNSEGDERLDAMQIAQCREMQLDELAALEAMYAESDEYVVADDADIDGLRERIEQWQVHDGVGDDLVSSIVQHPPTRFWLQLVLEDEANVMGTEEGVDLVATVLLQVTLSPSYPEASVPTMEVAYFCATDRNAQMSMDKALESLVHLEEDRLLQALAEQAQQVVPMPCVYEVAATWLPDHLFEYCKLRTHAQL